MTLPESPARTGARPADRSAATVRVRAFGPCRGRLPADDFDLEVRPGTTAGGLLRILRDRVTGGPLPGSLAIAVNLEVVRPSYELRAGDEIALVPPVSGG